MLTLVSAAKNGEGIEKEEVLLMAETMAAPEPQSEPTILGLYTLQTLLWPFFNTNTAGF